MALIPHAFGNVEITRARSTDSFAREVTARIQRKSSRVRTHIQRSSQKIASAGIDSFSPSGHQQLCILMYPSVEQLEPRCQPQARPIVSQPDRYGRERGGVRIGRAYPVDWKTSARSSGCFGPCKSAHILLKGGVGRSMLPSVGRSVGRGAGRRRMT